MCVKKQIFICTFLAKYCATVWGLAHNFLLCIFCYLVCAIIVIIMIFSKM